jgi:hypothetical protein
MLNQQEWSSELIPNTFPVSALSQVLKGLDMSLEEELLLSEKEEPILPELKEPDRPMPLFVRVPAS